MPRRRTSRSVLAVGAAALTVALGITLSSASSTAVTLAAPRPAHPENQTRVAPYDARQGATPVVKAAQQRNAARVEARPEAHALRSALGDQAVLDIDPTTGTVRTLVRLDGYLTGPSNESPTVVAKRYVSEHRVALGLTTGDLSTLRLRRDYRDVAGTHHLSWTQRIGGVDVFGNGLTASVTKTGRLLTVGGSPVTQASVGSRDMSQLPTGASAIRASRRDLSEPSVAPGPRDVAHKVLFVTSRGTHLGWQTVTMSADNPALSVFDARTGSILFRRSLRADADAPTGSTGRAFKYFPKAPTGRHDAPGRLHPRTAGWAARPPRCRETTPTRSPTSTTTRWPDASEEVHPSSGHTLGLPAKPFHLPGRLLLRQPVPVLVEPRQAVLLADQPQAERHPGLLLRQQVARPPAGSADRVHRGGRELPGVNSTGKGRGGDPVDTQTDDGANSDHGLPDGAHVDNANMDTPPDGQSPTMQMYLQHQPGTSYPDGDPFSPTNVGDEADTVYHEYTHGLSNRLVVDAAGNPALRRAVGCDGRGVERLVRHGLPGRPGSAEGRPRHRRRRLVPVRRRRRVPGPDRADRLQGGVDVRSVHRGRDRSQGRLHLRRLRTRDRHTRGARRQRDLGQTLWDLRDRSARPSRSRWSPGAWSCRRRRRRSSTAQRDPAADTAVRNGADRSEIWKVFASAAWASTRAPWAKGTRRPPRTSTLRRRLTRPGRISGRVTDADTHKPLAGVPVALAFQGRGAVNPTDTTDADGRYRARTRAGGSLRQAGCHAPWVRRGLPERDRDQDRHDGEHRAASRLAGGQRRRRRGEVQRTGLLARLRPARRPSTAARPAVGGPPPATTTATPPTTSFPSSSWCSCLRPWTSPVRRRPVGNLRRRSQCLDGRLPDRDLPGRQDLDDVGKRSLHLRRQRSDEPCAADRGQPGVKFVRFTILGNQTPDFATSCPGGAFSGCSFTDLTEVAVRNTALT